MSIRIDSLSPECSALFVAPAEGELFVITSSSSIWHCSTQPSVPSLLYGGASASVSVATAQPLVVASTHDSSIAPSQTAGPTEDVHRTLASTGNWSRSLQTVLDRPPAALPTHLVAGGIIFCSAFATWAMVGQVDEIGRAQGRLMPQGELYKVHPVVSGKIASVYVREGQSVHAGQVLAVLDDEIARNRVEWSLQARANYDQELLQTDALIDKNRLEVQARLAITHAEIRVQEATIAQAQTRIASQQAAIMQAEARALTNQALVSELKSDISIQQERLARFEYLVHEGALAREQLFQAQQQFADRQRSITQQTGEIQQAIVESQRLRADLQQAIAEVKRLRAELVRKYAEGQDTQLQSQQAMQQLQLQKTQLQAKIQENEKQLKQTKAELQQLTLRAPVEGVVSTLNVRNRGEVIQPGQTLAEIAPHGAPLILVAALPTREAGFVKVGERTQIKFDAYPYQDYGIISGKVVTISPDVKPDEKLGAVYRVEVSLDRNSVSKDNQLIRLKAGQTATAEIVIRQHRIADIVLDPIRKLQKSNLSL